MSVKPILFNGMMVRAILDGRKTVTRRIVKLKYSNTHLEMRTDKYGARLIELQNDEPGVTTIKNPDGTTTHTLLSARVCHPPYRPGDILYVRETWGDYREETMEGDSGYFYLYRADYPDGATSVPLPESERTDYADSWDLPKWHPSIHMPREAARIWLWVTDVRVEQLQEITWQQAAAEGCQGKACDELEPRNDGLLELPTLRGAFRDLWDSTIKHADLDRYGWDANPWVWVIEFERCEKPEEADADA